MQRCSGLCSWIHNHSTQMHRRKRLDCLTGWLPLSGVIIGFFFFFFGFSIILYTLKIIFKKINFLKKQKTSRHYPCPRARVWATIGNAGLFNLIGQLGQYFAGQSTCHRTSGLTWATPDLRPRHPVKGVAVASAQGGATPKPPSGPSPGVSEEREAGFRGPPCYSQSGEVTRVLCTQGQKGSRESQTSKVQVW